MLPKFEAFQKCLSLLRPSLVIYLRFEIPTTSSSAIVTAATTGHYSKMAGKGNLTAIPYGIEHIRIEQKPIPVYKDVEMAYPIKVDTARSAIATAPKTMVQDSKMAQKDMTAIQHGIEDIRLEQGPIPMPKDDEMAYPIKVDTARSAIATEAKTIGQDLKMTEKDNMTAMQHGIEDIRLEQRPIPIPIHNEMVFPVKVDITQSAISTAAKTIGQDTKMAEKDMTAIQHGIKDIRLEQTPIPVPIHAEMVFPVKVDITRSAIATAAKTIGEDSKMAEKGNLTAAQHEIENTKLEQKPIPMPRDDGPKTTASKTTGQQDSKMAEKDNLTAILYGIDDIRLEQRPIPVPKDDEVLLQMESVGICGSDVHYYVSGGIGEYIVKEPMIMGHEASGTVVKVGASVKNLKPGDRVAIEPGVPCRRCNYCKTGQYNLCPDVIFCATPPVHGNLGRYYTHAADFCYKLPNNVSLDEGAFLEPLSVGVHASKQGGVNVDSKVLILGGGPIGLVTLLSAKAMGASQIIVADTIDFRLHLAEEVGATHTVHISPEDTDLDVVKKITDLFGGQQANISIDCRATEQSIRTAIHATKSGGRVVMVGMGKQLVTIPLISALSREVAILGCFRYANDYPTALELIASGKVNVKPLITHHYSIEETRAAFDRARSGEGNPIKILIHANKNWKRS